MSGEVEFNKEDLSRLRDAIVNGDIPALEPHQENGRRLIEEKTGRYYGDSDFDDDSRMKRPANKIAEMDEIYEAQLVSDVPRAMVRARDRKLSADARAIETDVNQWAEEEDFGFEQCNQVMDTLYYGMGIIKNGICAEQPIDLDDETVMTGRPFAKHVNFEDYGYDTSASRWDQIAYEFDISTWPIEYVKENKYYNAKALKKLQPVGKQGGEDEDIGDLSVGPNRINEFCEKVRLADIYLYHENVLLTVDFDGDWTQPLRAVEWTGCYRGPYQRLRFIDVPGNLMPLSAMGLVYDLFDLYNRLLNKVGRQAEREKTNYVFWGEGTKLADQLLHAADGAGLQCASPTPPSEIHTGGVNQSTMALTIMLGELFNRMGGNLDILGGLSPQSPTAAQDSLLSQSANRRVEKMQRRALQSTRRCFREAAYNLYCDPVGERDLRFTLPGHSKFQSTMRWGPEKRNKNIKRDFDFDISPYSYQAKTPATEVAALTQLMTQIVLPLAPMLQSQGLSIDGRALLSEYGRLLDKPTLSELIVNVGGGQQVGETENGQQSIKPPTHSIYERKGSPGGSTPGKMQTLMQMAMANAGGNKKGVQEKERAMAGVA